MFKPKKNKTARVVTAKTITGKVELLAPVSKNFIRGYLITRPEEIVELAKNKKSIYSRHHGIKPAAFYQNWQLWQIVVMIRNEVFYYITTND